MSTHRILPLSALLFLSLSPAHAAETPDTSKLPPAATRKVDFVRDIQPLLKEACIKCHGAEKQKGGLRLDAKDLALKGGENHAPNIIAGKSAESPLIHFIAGMDEDMMMPPKGDPLTPEQIGLLRAWIDQGAEWPDEASAKVAVADPREWWSFKALTRPAVPDAGAGVSPVDAFLRAKLAEKKLMPSPEADRRTLIRRLSLVLLGLPPTPEQVEAFVQDADAQAYERLVDELMKSPRFGERWAQHWLDVVRFAESNGSESNLYRRNAWPYRDYVIRAFNEDLPLNRFIREQLAGDALGADEATAFLVAGPFTTPDTVGKEETAIKQARADQLEEMIQSVSASLLGVTMGCARCHNHKFDPIPQADYYSLAAVFAGVEFGHREWRSHAAQSADKAQVIRAEIAKVRDDLHSKTSAWTEEWPTHLQTQVAPVSTRAVRITLAPGTPVIVDELQLFGPDTGDKNLALAANGAKASTNKQKEDALRPVANVNDGITDRFHDWRAGGMGATTKPMWLQIDLPAEAKIDRIELSSDRDTLQTTAYLTGAMVGPRKFTIEVQDREGVWQEVAKADLTPIGQKALAAEVRERLTKLAQLAGELSGSAGQLVFAGSFVKPPPTFLLGRGDPMSPRDEMKPNALSVFHADLRLDSTTPDQKRRLALAEWMTDPQRNPLTPRVLANRLWLHVFGRGIVETPGDFGKMGSPPSHPELLDWLASELIANGWSAKTIIRQLVTSAAFRQSSAPNAEAQLVDADARLLWRFPPRRAEAEVLRDSTLAVAGTLDLTMGGPGYRIHADRKRFEGWQVTDNAGPQTWRRLIYQERMRGIDDRMFTAFDRPECGQVTPKRTSSTTPLQALNLLNGPFILAQSAKLAERINRDAGEDMNKQMQRAFTLVFGRAATDDEITGALAVAKSDGLAALCRAMLNANEFVFIQ